MGEYLKPPNRQATQRKPIPPISKKRAEKEATEREAGVFKAKKPIAKFSAKRKAEMDAGLFKLQVGKPLKRFTPARQKLENEKHAMYAKEAEEREPFCRGCGTTQNLSHSHRVSQNNRELIAKPENVDYYCQGVCHPAYENGRIYELDNGNDVLDWLANTDGQRYRAKVYKMMDRIADDNLSLEDLPGWVEAHVLAITN